MDEDPSDPRSHRVSLKVFIYIASVLVFIESESFQILQWMFCGKTWHLLLQREVTFDRIGKFKFCATFEIETWGERKWMLRTTTVTQMLKR